MKAFKQKVYEQLVSQVNDTIQLYQTQLNELQQSASEETKSTAGDKHETALAMLQIEQENIQRRLDEALAQKSALEKINFESKAEQVVAGSLIKTDKGYFILSIALGKIIADDKTIIALSPQSPLGKNFLTAKEKDTVEFNGNRYRVEAIE